MFTARLGVRTRVLAIALVPSLALLVIGVGGAGYLVVEGRNARDWAVALRDFTPLTKELVGAVQQERQLTLAQFGEHDDPKGVAQARLRLDAALRAFAPTTATMEKMGPDGVKGDVGGFNTLIAQLAAVRTQVDASVLSLSDAYTFYSHLLDVISIGTQAVQTTAPSAEVAVETGETLTIVGASEMLSRSHSLAAILANDIVLPPELAVEFSRLVGGYRVSIETMATSDEAERIAAAKAITAMPAWTQLAVMENSFLARALNPITSAKPSTAEPLPFTVQEWQDASNQVNTALLELWNSQSNHAQGLAADAADRDARNSAYAGGAMFLVAVAAFGVALVLANRIIRRLKRLRDQTFALADERLPEIMHKLRDGEQVNAETETPPLDFGTDEIGQVAEAFSHAHAAAVAAAITEARTREGVKAVFLNIAHRSQVVVHRQLEVLDEAESKQEDPALLELFFRLDHLATRERRNAENLIILAGGQPGRQWRNPVALVEVVRSGVGEAHDYTRVKIARLPEVSVAGSAVADLVHLIAELVDNAAHFSPPQSQVSVRGNVVGKGVAVEIVDQGMGIPESELARINDMLRNPPDFGVNTLSEDSRLGMFVVAQLAMRNGITVKLSESDYGGVRAIVLVPSGLTVPAGGTGEIPAVPRQLEAPAGAPALPAGSNTGRFPATSGSTGTFPAVHGNTGAFPAATRETGAFPAPTGDTGAFPALPGNTGAFPVVSGNTGAFPATAASDRAEPLEPRYPPHQMSFDTPAPFEPPTNPSPRHAQQPLRLPRENGFRSSEFDGSHYTGSDVRPALPRRRRQASLAPELAQEKATSEAPPEPTRTAEQARDLMSAIANGTRQGRQADPGAISPTSHGIQDRQEGDGDHLKRW
ncbi:nitrate- and nitrite sensing domain-containing protein [Nocardia sp. 2]|uniref:histidine kinase n=1 Tax=Nocardia acididurans TaxID=2802282 RepID=A0ABS1M0B6_9NOCA|nr:nitrate- and nitrite sensing domain-containing protein [Nocardia acididurans]MBL1073624.1 nitrate- and nitrite sensing domain-containing protein [Nocardia acididurans]